jgi:thioesterase domain-containing protein
VTATGRGGQPDLLRTLRAKLRRDMPITRALGLRVVGTEGGGLVLNSPLAPNINHKGTAFAGSLNATATLAGWGTIWLLLREHGIRSHVVIQDSTVHYVRPVTGDFTARCRPPSPGAAERLVNAVKRRGRGRIELDVLVADASGDAVRFHGRYVAFGTGGAAGLRSSGAAPGRHPA